MKTLIIKLSLIAAILPACVITSRAQTAIASAKVNGSVVDAQGPVGYTTVSIIRAKDSTIVAGTLTTDAGAYTFDHIHNGIYLVRAQGVGYQNAFSKPFAVSNGTPSITVPVIHMVSANRTLTTVNVTATKPLIERQTDKTVMNVAGSVLAAGNSAMDILERAPGVSVDKDDNISLRGKQGVTVMINGKLTYLSAQQLATLLRSTDGNSIQSIELITNPSAKYDAAGNSGIINIVLKKSKEKGTNGSIIATGGFSAYTNDNTTLTLNHKQGNLNVFGSFNHGDYENGRDLNIFRTVTDSSKSTYFNQYNYMKHDNHWNNYRFGADYDLSSKNTIGFIVNGYFNTELDNNADNTYIGSAPGEVDSIQRTPGVFKQSYKDFAINLNDRWKLDTAGQELNIDLDYSKFNNNSRNYYVTNFLRPDGTTQQDNQYLQEQTPSTIDIHTAKADYTKPLSKTVNLEAGVKFSDVKTDNDLEAQKLQNNVYVNDTTKTNRFIYDEKIDAGYLNLKKSFKNTSVQVGLRAEYTQSRGDLVTKDSVVQRSYLNLFPSFFLNHTFSTKNEMSFSYSRRIDRPSYQDLNPFIYYLDQYTYQKGNPFLKPQYTNNFELDYTYNKTLNVSLNYSHTNDAITEIILTNVARKATYQTTLNLQTQDSYSVDINSPYTITKWWSGNAELNVFDLQFRSDSLFGGNLSDGKLAYQIKATQTFTCLGIKAELFTRYNSAMIYGIYHLHPRWSNDVGFSRSFYQKKLNIKFAVTDVFNTWTNNLDANYQADNFLIKQKGQTRGARLTLTYNFGNSKIKASEHHSGAEDESQRVKGGN
ncbi:MAG: TonB-dependent receptor domain-containing protein [Mucilaginibacter sp.]